VRNVAGALQRRFVALRDQSKQAVWFDGFNTDSASASWLIALRASTKHGQKIRHGRRLQPDCRRWLQF